MNPEIPVRNIWLLMLYASEARYLERSVLGDAEQNPEKIPDLIAELLCDALERRLRQGLSLGFENATNQLPRVKGRVDFLETYSKRLLQFGRIQCSFDQVTPNTFVNRYSLGALVKLQPMIVSSVLSGRCRRLINWMKSLGIEPLRQAGSSRRVLSGSRLSGPDGLVIALASLAWDLQIPSSGDGRVLSYYPKDDDRWLRVLFEKAIAGFFRLKAGMYGWSVSSGKWMSWQISELSENTAELLPKMKTDVFMEHADSERRIIIDTKFNEILVAGHYRERSIRSGYLYQMYAYLMSQRTPENADKSLEGILLHPSYGEELDEFAVIQGNRIRFLTIDLLSGGFAWQEKLLSVLSQ